MGCRSCKDGSEGENTRKCHGGGCGSESGSATYGSLGNFEMSRRSMTSEGPSTETPADQSGMIESVKYVHGLHTVAPKTKKHLQRLQRG